MIVLHDTLLWRHNTDTIGDKNVTGTCAMKMAGWITKTGKIDTCRIAGIGKKAMSGATVGRSEEPTDGPTHGTIDGMAEERAEETNGMARE